MRLTDFKVLTFDTFGTLIDWQSGILKAFEPLIARIHPRPDRTQIMTRFDEAETAQQTKTPGLIYSELLATVYRTLAKDWGVAIEPGEAARFGASVGDWPAFADSRAALKYLKDHYTLITLTNCDQASYRGTSERLGNPWNAIYTAQEIGSYKPSHRNFDYLLDHVRTDFGFDRKHILHTAQGLYHDHVPATAMGIATAWIDRRDETQGYAGTMPPPSDYRLDFTFKGMAPMVRAHQKELAAG